MRSLVRFCFANALLSIFSVSALAGGWQGIYGGGHLGWMSGLGQSIIQNLDADNGGTERFDGNDPGFYLTEIDVLTGESDSSLIGGAHIGYNFQLGGSPIVIGVEGDVDIAEQVDYLASVRARLAYGTDTFLIYATGGAAFAEFDDNNFDVVYNDSFPGTPTFKSSSANDANDVGYVVGGGVELKGADQQVSFGIEGLYYNFGDASKTVQFEDNGAPSNIIAFTSKENADFWQVRARVTFYPNSH